ncbi:MAG: hypothetical protein OXD41_05785, partial [Thaumarchaeota archaeon]|nr:hypothetical protein [Nitrososphaerota archaeon]
MSRSLQKGARSIRKMGKKIFFVAFFGGILLTSTITIGIPGILPQPEVTITNTPQDRFADVDRPVHCGTPGAGSTPYVQEYEIERPCTKPLAITTDDDGNVWFTQTNTGNLGMYDPETGEFSEFFNPSWPRVDSMMWGIEHYEDGSIWYTEDRLNSVWKYIVDEGAYLNVPYGEGDDTFPHRITELGTQLVINDYTGGRINFFNPTPGSNELGYWTLDSPDRAGITSEVAFDSSFDMWFTNWRDGEGGKLVRFDTGDYYDAFNDLPDNSTDVDINPDDYVTTFDLPEGAPTINGVASDAFSRIWLSDTSSSNLYMFNAFDEEYTKYTTPRPRISSYGNASGAVIEPISRPYFADSDDRGRIVFNEQTSNRISVLDPFTDELVEYTIPSRNPNWSDCEEEDLSCGIAQVLGFHADGDMIWFTEWVENNIGVVDTSVELPYTVEIDPQTVTMTANATESVILRVGVNATAAMAADAADMGANATATEGANATSATGADGASAEVTFSAGRALEMSSTAGIFGVDVEVEAVELPVNGTADIGVEIIADGAREGTHKVALGIGDENVAVTRYLTIVIGTEEDVAAAAEAAASFGEPIEIVVEPPPDEGAGEPIEIVVEPPPDEGAGEPIEIVVEPPPDEGAGE